jgi:hypothetical protein
VAGVRQVLQADLVEGCREAAGPGLGQHARGLVGAGDAVPGRGHEGEVLSCAAGRVQDAGGGWAGAQQPGRPASLRLGAVDLLVVGGGVLVVAGEDGCTPLVQPRQPARAASVCRGDGCQQARAGAGCEGS